MSEIVKILRACAPHTTWSVEHGKTLAEAAADQIESLTEEVERLRAAPSEEKARADEAEADATLWHEASKKLVDENENAHAAIARHIARAEAAEARVKELEADCLDFDPETIKVAEELQLSGISGELVDAVASSIRADGSDLCDGAWSAVPEASKSGWRGDAIRALAALVKMRPVVKEYLTSAGCVPRSAPLTRRSE